MGAQIGFVVLSHSQPELLRRLLSTLDRVYRNPPIVVRHDFSQCTLPDDAGGWSTDLKFVLILRIGFVAVDPVFAHAALRGLDVSTGDEHTILRFLKGELPRRMRESSECPLIAGARLRACGRARSGMQQVCGRARASPS